MADKDARLGHGITHFLARTNRILDSNDDSDSF
jgi:hypothetical protein